MTIAPQLRLPVAIATLGFLFLGVFLLWPLFNVFGASLLDSEGASFTFANYGKMLGRPFYRGAILNTLQIGVLATVVTTVLAIIVESINKVGTIISEISAATADQMSGFMEVSKAIGQLDEMTQQNAALVEQAAAAAESLEEQAHNLNEAVGQFRLSH